MIACVVRIDYFVVGIYAFRVPICDAFLSQFNGHACKEKLSRLISRN